MSERNFSPWSSWLAGLSAVRHEDPPPESVAALLEWRLRRRQRLAELLGSFPNPVPLNLETLSSEQCDGYVRHRVVFDAEATMSVAAFLLIPNARRTPGAAVIAIHGHGPGKDLICGLTGSESPDADFAVQLVRENLVVLAPDLRAFGERRDRLPEGYYPCDTNLVHASLAGVNPLTQNLFDLQCCLEVLVSHPLVDERRIGAAGFSYGATMSLFLAAVDRRVAATVVAGYLSSLSSSHAVALNLCGSQVLFGMLGRLEHVDVAAQIAPRPLCVVSGDADPLFPVEAARDSVAQLRRVYDALGARPGSLVHDVFDGGHQWHGAVALPFLAWALGSS